MDDRGFDDAWLLCGGTGIDLGAELGLLGLLRPLSSWLRIFILGLCHGVLNFGRIHAQPWRLSHRIFLLGLFLPVFYWSFWLGLATDSGSHSDIDFLRFKF